jgi:HlyD family secretion protein
VKRSWILLAILVAALIVSLAFLRMAMQPLDPTATAKASTPPQPQQVVGLGRVEPVSEEVRVSAEVGGRLQEVLVDEGRRVSRGDLIAVIDNQDYRARVRLAEAEIQSREAELKRILTGARMEERREAAAGVKEAEAAVAQAGAELRRYRALYADQLTAREQVEIRETAQAQAEARLEAARQRQALVEATARAEDRDRAEAQVRLARERLAEAQSLLDKTSVRAPIAGIVLRRHFRSGETVPAGAPIVTMGDVGRMRVRMELDERDIARIQVGQPVYCTADAFGGRRFNGRIVRVGQMLGRKNVRTDDPAERADTKVLEVLIELEAGAPLPPGLRVDVFVPAGQDR